MQHRMITAEPKALCKAQKLNFPQVPEACIQLYGMLSYIEIKGFPIYFPAGGSAWSFQLCARMRGR